MEHSASHTGHAASATTYNINLSADSPPAAGTPCELSFVVTEQRVGEPLEDFELLHDRLMHLIIVDDSLSYFAHVHPVLQAGAFHLSHAFPSAGQYKLWAEVKPAGADSVLVAFRIAVTPAGATPELSEGPHVARYQVSLTPASALLHQPVELIFQVADPDGKPLSDLEPLMAAGGHCVIISSDLRDFLHVHPLEDVEPTWRGGPVIKFLTNFHRPGRYKVWGQFQHQGELITADFDLSVNEGSHR